MNIDTENKGKLYQYLWILILASTFIRGILASVLNLGNDEVYYWTYAMFPDWSHFDHPPMVGWVIQLFSLNLTFDSELFIRLSSVIFGSINTYLIFNIGRKLKNEKTGWYAALLYTSSIYGFVINGIFILPDTPQFLFWLLSLNILMDVLPDKGLEKKNQHRFIFAGLLMGIAMLSKYTSAFLWLGSGLYILFFNRNWLKSYATYLAAIISAICLLPIIIWNFQNDFISFTFHGDRVGVTESGINWGTFLTEIGGQLAYNNPIVYILIIIALISLFKKSYIEGNKKFILLLTALPMIGLFLGFALFRSTLPHWTAPGVSTLIIFAGAWVAEKNTIFFPKIIKYSLGLISIVLILGLLQIKLGAFESLMREGSDDKSLGKYDFSLDMYGWDQIAEPMGEIISSDIENGLMDTTAIFLSNKWFPAAHIDYYVAHPLNKKLLSIGSLVDIHKYNWISQERGGFHLGMDAYFITTSTQFYEPDSKYHYSKYFDKIELAETIQITRNNKAVKNIFVYRLKGLKKIPKVY